jgi:hypothetical protein
MAEELLQQMVNLMRNTAGPAHGAIDTFDGTGNTAAAKQWLEQLETISITYGWHEQHKLLQAKTHLTGAAQLWLRTQPATSLSAWAAFSTAFKATFVGKESTIDTWKRMSERTQKKGEPT